MVFEISKKSLWQYQKNIQVNGEQPYKYLFQDNFPK